MEGQRSDDSTERQSANLDFFEKFPFQKESKQLKRSVQILFPNHSD